MNLRIQAILDPWISQALIEECLDNYQSYITGGFLRYFKSGKRRQFAIDELINCKKNLAGDAAKNIVTLYESLNLRDDSIQKLNNRIWYKKAKGIYELYMMNQEQVHSEILKYTNSKNEYVRMEAQTAVIGFLGFKGLIFLNTLNKPLTSWQQIKLLEQLKVLNLIEEIEDLPNWLKSENDYVILFALKLTEIYQQMQVHDETVSCLLSKNENVRTQAIKTLSKISNEKTASILIRYYEGESQRNKTEILRSLAVVAQERELDFLLAQLENDDDNLKLDAAIAIAKCSHDGLKILEGRIHLNPETNNKIYLHVKNKLLA